MIIVIICPTSVEPKNVLHDVITVTAAAVAKSMIHVPTYYLPIDTFNFGCSEGWANNCYQKLM